VSRANLRFDAFVNKLHVFFLAGALVLLANKRRIPKVSSACPAGKVRPTFDP
jgi:hypothetical protein